MHAPLIITLVLDDQAQAWFDAVRRRHFPPERLQVGAHVTMFHALPGEHEAEIAGLLASQTRACAAMPVAVGAPYSLGRGVAFRLSVPEAESLRADLARAWAGALTPQDRAPWRPHVTVQNKASPAAARQTLADLAAAAPPAPVRAEGVALWRYRGGPWEMLARFPFTC